MIDYSHFSLVLISTVTITDLDKPENTEHIGNCLIQLSNDFNHAVQNNDNNIVFWKTTQISLVFSWSKFGFRLELILTTAQTASKT